MKFHKEVLPQNEFWNMHNAVFTNLPKIFVESTTFFSSKSEKKQEKNQKNKSAEGSYGHQRADSATLLKSFWRESEDFRSKSKISRKQFFPQKDILKTFLWACWFQFRITLPNSFFALRKMNKNFSQKKFLESFLWTQRMQFCQLCRSFFARRPKAFLKVQEDSKHWKFVFKKSSKCSAEHVECGFDNTAISFLSKNRNSSAPKEKQSEKKFCKNPYKISFGHAQCSFHNPANKSTDKLPELFFCSEFKTKLAKKFAFQKTRYFHIKIPLTHWFQFEKTHRIICRIKAEICSESPIKFKPLLFQKKTLSCKIILWAGKMQFR